MENGVIDRILEPGEIKNLNLMGEELVRVGVINDGSSILTSTSKGSTVKSINKRVFVGELREELANKLDNISSNSHNSEKIKEILRSGCNIDERFNAFLAKTLKIKLYTININGDISKYGGKSKKCVVVYKMPSHYDLIGYREHHGITLTFDQNHPLIIDLEKISKAIKI